jgi:hypothetical protein
MGLKVRIGGRQEAHPGADAFERGGHLRLFVQREVIEPDDIAGLQGRREHLLDLQERRVVERPLEDRRAVRPATMVWVCQCPHGG